MSKIQNVGLDQYGTELFEQQRFGTAGIEGVNILCQWDKSLSVNGGSSLMRLRFKGCQVVIGEASIQTMDSFVYLCPSLYTER